MNPQLQQYAKESIIKSMQQMDPKHQELFKLMYGRNGGHRSVEEAKALSIEAVVAEMDDYKLDRAMIQIQNTVPV